jgi:RNA polymerase sigma factor (sigma-70 family)
MAQISTPPPDALHRPLSNTELVHRIRSDDSYALELLYRKVSRGLTIYFRRRAGSDADDLTNRTFLAVVEGLKRKGMVQPECLMGYVRTIARCELAGYIGDAVRRRREVPPDETIRDGRADAEAAAIDAEQRRIMEEQLRAMPARDREVITRFYVLGQSGEQIQTALGLSETQFRLLKSRAKAIFVQRVQNRLGRRHVGQAYGAPRAGGTLTRLRTECAASFQGARFLATC